MKRSSKKAVKKHLKEDIETFHKEAAEDKELIKKLSKSSSKKKRSKKDPKKVKGSAKIEKVMHEFKERTLHSGSKKGPKVKSRKQAVAIAFSEAGKLKKKKRKK